MLENNVNISLMSKSTGCPMVGMSQILVVRLEIKFLLFEKSNRENGTPGTLFDFSVAARTPFILRIC